MKRKAIYILFIILPIIACGINNTNNFNGSSTNYPAQNRIEGKFLRVINIALLKWLGRCDDNMNNYFFDVSNSDGYYFVFIIDKTKKTHGIIQGKKIFQVILNEETLEVVDSFACK